MKLSNMTISEAARDLNLPLVGKGNVFHSPFRVDKKPSFSIFNNGRRFKDFSTGESGDAITFWMKARNCDFKTAIKEMGVENKPYTHFNAPKQAYSYKTRDNDEKPIIPPLSWNESEAVKLTDKRGFSVSCQERAFKAGYFGFYSKKGISYWLVKDKEGNVAQIRRVDGLSIQLKENQVKALTLPKSKCSIPIGYDKQKVKDASHIVICEGGTDFLTACHFAELNGLSDKLAILAMLGATQNIAPNVLPLFANKEVLIFPDNDNAGKAALNRWGKSIEAYANVCYFDFEGYHTQDGKPVKDLNDFLRIDYDEWDNGRPITENPFCGFYKETEEK